MAVREKQMNDDNGGGREMHTEGGTDDNMVQMQQENKQEMQIIPRAIPQNKYSKMSIDDEQSVKKRTI